MASATCSPSCPPLSTARRSRSRLARRRAPRRLGRLGATTFIITVADRERRQIGPFDVEFIPVTHSVPNGFATAFHTPAGVILHSGDFKLDLTPVDNRRTDLARIGAIASTEGIRLLLADSTNVEEQGYTQSERSVGASLRVIFPEHRNHRIIVACFASHLHRIQEICDAAIANNRKIALPRPLDAAQCRPRPRARPPCTCRAPSSPRSRASTTSPVRVCVISTGSQGERRCRASRSSPPARTAASPFERERRRHPLLARHPRQRVGRLEA